MIRERCHLSVYVSTGERAFSGGRWEKKSVNCIFLLRIYKRNDLIYLFFNLKYFIFIFCQYVRLLK